MKRMKKYWPRVVAVPALALVLIAPVPVGVAQGNKDKDDKGNGSNGNPRVYPPNSRPYGMTYGEWAAKHFQTFSVLPISTTDCSLGQSGPVWFLAPPGGGSTTRSCTIPAGKSILFPITGIINDYPCPPEFNFEPAPGQSLEDFLTESAQSFIDLVTELEVVVDGEPLENLFNYRATSPLFIFTGHPSFAVFDPCITGTPQPAVSDGYWIMLKHLKVGTHTIFVRSKLVFPGGLPGLPEGESVEAETSYLLTVVK